MAQDADTPPATAAEGLQWLAAGLAALAGLLAYAVTDAIKRIPWLNDEEKSKISGPMANLVAAVVSIASGYLVGSFGQVAGFLDESGLWQVVVFAWPAAKAWFEVTPRHNYVELQSVLEEVREVEAWPSNQQS
jgi:hypothetical protein